MADERVLMKFYAYAVAAEFLDNRIAVLMRKLRHGSTDIAKLCPGLCSLNAAQQALLSNSHQVSSRLSNLANHEHTRSISIIAIINCRNIDVYNIAAAQHVAFARNTVANLVVNRRTYALGEALVAQRCRRCTMSNGEIIYNAVNLRRRHTSLDVLGNLVQHSCINLAGCTDTGNLLRRFNHIAGRNLHSLLLQQRDFLVIHLVALSISLAAATPT